jgi:PAS domain S-box-containing protein
VAFLTTDETGSITSANPRAEALVGIPGLVGHQLEQFLEGSPPASATGTVVVRPAAGPAFPVFRTVLRLESGFGHVLVDLRTTDGLREAFAPANSMPARLVDALDVGVVVQFAGKIVSANPAAAATLGLTLDELLGRTSVDPRWRSVHEDGTTYAGEEHPAMVAARTGTRVRSVMGIHTPVGELRWIDVDARPLLVHDGRVLATATSFTDVTARREADEARAATLVRYETLLAEASDAILLVEPGGAIRYAGPSAGHTLGRALEELTGTSVLSLASAAARPELARALEHCAAQPHARTAATIAVGMPGGDRRWFEVRIRNALDLPEVDALVVSLTDVHDRVVAAERLRTVNDELEARLAERDDQHRLDRELATATELLGHCTDDREVRDVVWTAAVNVFGGTPTSLLVARPGTSLLDCYETTAERRDIDADDCWGMRTHRVHLSRRDDGLACAHLDPAIPAAICIPLGLATRPYGLLVVQADDGAHLDHARALADRLGPLLARVAIPVV